MNLCCKSLLVLALVAAVLSGGAEAGKGKGKGRGRRGLAQHFGANGHELGFQMADFLLPLFQDSEQLLPKPTRGRDQPGYHCARCRGTAAPKEVRETARAWLITLDTAGFTPEELDITVKGNELTVKGRHKCKHGGLCIPRKLDRVYDLSTVNVERRELSSRRTPDGALEVTIPKATVRKVAIAVAEHPAPAEAAVAADEQPVAAEPDADASGDDAEPAAAGGSTDGVGAGSEDAVTGTEATPLA